MKKNILAYSVVLSLLFIHSAFGQNTKIILETEIAMLKATKYMVEEVSTNGGYVWHYLPDFSRRWGEMEAYKTMVWLQHPGTVSMGHVFLDAYKATGNEYYYEAAKKAASAIIWGQSAEGGWNYMIDFAGDRSLKHWYNTIGKNGWRLEEFQHYYGNCTFDDDITSDAARFLLRMYLEKMDPSYKPALDKAIEFILKSQYPSGGWPQRYPLKYDFVKHGHPDYTSFYTFNDDVTWENIHFLIQCYLTLGQDRFLDPIFKGMNFYLLSQDGSGGWGQQIDMSLKAVGARTYEPDALLPGATYGNAILLLKFYQYTGDKKFLNHVPIAIRWLEETALPKDKTEKERYSHPTFIDPETNKPIYVHRKGSNAFNGLYYCDDNDQNLLGHYYGKCRIPIDRLKDEYNRLTNLSINEVTKDSPLISGPFYDEGTPQKFYNLNRIRYDEVPEESQVKSVIQSLDHQNRWLTKNIMISNPYIGDGQLEDPATLTNDYATTFVGDKYDTSPFRDTSDQEYISTGVYIRNMQILINYINSVKPKDKRLNFVELNKIK